MGTDKRERQRAGRAQRLEEARAAQTKAARRQRFIFIGLIALLVLVLAVVSTVWSRRDESASSSSTSTTAATSTPPSSAAPGALPPLAPGAAITGDTPCPAADGSAARTTTFAKAPPTCIDAAKTYTAKVSTTKGDFTIALDPKAAPLTVNNFVVLSRYHFYDGVPFHRVIPGFMAQTGDPTGPTFGQGDPGYKFADELPTGDPAYKAGSVAMANSGPNTNGGQFFVYVGPNPLGPNYSLFGQVTEGLDTTVAAIVAGGSSGQAGTPVDPAWINYILIGEDGTYPTPPPTTAPPTTAPTVPTASVPTASITPPVSTP